MVVLTALLLAAATALPDNITTDWQKRTWAPASLRDVRPHYEIGSGEGVLDLGELPLKGGRTVHTGAEVGFGRLQVTLPQGVTTRLHISLGLGDIQLPGESPQDVSLSGGGERTLTLPADGLKKGEKPRGSLDLALELGAGQVVIERSEPASAPAPAAPPPPVSPTAPTPQGAPE